MHPAAHREVSLEFDVWCKWSLDFADFEEEEEEKEKEKEKETRRSLV